MIKRGLLNDLILKYNLELLEKHIVFTYIINNKLKYNQNDIIKSYFSGFEKNTKLFFDISTLHISTIKELENYLELIIPENDRKLNGAFFTPDYIVDFIINELQPKENDLNLDPSCGCGAFLIGLIEYYRKKFNKSTINIIKENIYGADIIAYNINRTKIILAIYALQNGEILHEGDINLFCQDSLKTNWKVQFDNIVGNPPYVKFQDLSDENRQYLIQNWTTIEGGTFNLYFAFFELGYKILKNTGKLGYITPNNYFTSLAGESIRKYFQQKKCITRIIDFSHKKVFDAQTYTAITFLNKQVNESITYDRIKDGYEPDVYLSIANGSPNYLKDLNYKKWRLLKSEEQNIIRIIETIGTPIGNLFDICVGIATLKDEIYFVDGSIEKNGYYLKKTKFGLFEIEKDVTKPVYKISDFSNQEDLETNNRKIIFPYNIIKGVAIPISEMDFKIKYPLCYAYLLSEKDNLLARDKGKVKYEPFFVWGRTQGLTRIGKKILNPTFSKHPRFLLVNDAESFFTNGYGIFYKTTEVTKSLIPMYEKQICKEENFDVLQKILNSYLMHYYISKTSISIEGGYPCYQKNFIEKFTIPDFSELEIRTLKMLQSKNDIDNYLMQKYQLNLPIPNLFT